MSVVIAASTLGLIGLIIALLITCGQRLLRVTEHSIIDDIDAKLPQAQCGQCGYPGCYPYAQAIWDDGIAINRCAPGGQETIVALAKLLGKPELPLDTEYGEPELPAIAVIQEDKCIGCSLCINACPVDAIIGAPKYMHSVIGELCTGCKLCVAPCPVDCIEVITC